MCPKYLADKIDRLFGCVNNLYSRLGLGSSIEIEEKGRGSVQRVSNPPQEGRHCIRAPFLESGSDHGGKGGGSVQRISNLPQEGRHGIRAPSLESGHDHGGRQQQDNRIE